jgi:pimeloyl-ACP methyl ester carboxylesterase
MATYVLVHGGWSGAHGFRHVRRFLQRAGHEVFTPSLTGIGERVHLASPQVDLSTHISDVVNAVLYEDLEEMVLLGYSYGGAVVTGALRHIAGRVRDLVYLDAFVPEDGDTVWGLAGREGSGTTITLGEVWLVPPMPREYDDPAEGAWQQARRVPHPARCFTEPVRLDKPLEDHPFGLTYVKATADSGESPNSAFWQAARHARSSARWRYHEIATNHMVASNRPEDLAEVLLAVR